MRLKSFIANSVPEAMKLVRDTLGPEAVIVSTQQGNRTHAANILGISIRTLRNKLKAYSQDGIPVPGPRESDRAPA